MDVLSKEDFYLHKEKYLGKILHGELFVHPTDTIYGIGCNAMNELSVNKVRLLKQRSSMPFSILVPSKEWVYTHCIVDNESTEWVEKMPGPYTLILRLKDPNSVPQAVHPGVDTIGVRIPDHWFSSIIAETGVPIITTSANVTGQQFMTNIDNLNDDIRSKCDFIIYEGEKRGRPSTVIELHKDEVELLHR